MTGMTRPVIVAISLLSIAASFSGCAIFRPEPRLVDATGAYSQSLVYAGLLYTAGLVPRDAGTGAVVTGDITAQTHGIMDSIEGQLKNAGCTLKDIIKLDVYLTDPGDFAKMAAVMKARFAGHDPALTAMPAAKARSAVLLEVDLGDRIP